MAVTGFWYPAIIPIMAQAGVGAGPSTFNWVADSASIKCALMGTNFTGNSQSLSVGDYWNDISTYEASGTGYTAGGKTVGTTAVAVSSTSNKTVKFSAGASVVWTTATLTARGAVVYKAGAAASNSPVMFFLDFGADVPATAGDFTITWHTDGMATITTA